MVRRKAETSQMFWNQCSVRALRRKGQEGGVRDRGAEDDDQRAEQEDIRPERSSRSARGECGSSCQDAIGFRRLAMRVNPTRTGGHDHHQHDRRDGRGADPVEGHHGALVQEGAHHHLPRPPQQMRRGIGGETGREDQNRPHDQPRRRQRQDHLHEGPRRRGAQRGRGLQQVFGDVFQNTDQQRGSSCGMKM